MAKKDYPTKDKTPKQKDSFSKTIRDIASLSQEELLVEVERLESYVMYGEGPDRDQPLLRLCALLLQRPDLGINGGNAGWAGRRLQVLLENYYSGQGDILLDRGDVRTAFSSNSRDPKTGLQWPTLILYEYDNLPPKGELKGEAAEDRVHKNLQRHGFPFGAHQVKAMYYEAKKSEHHLKELENYYSRFPFLKKGKSCRKTSNDSEA